MKDREIGLEEFEREGERLLDRLYVARACFAPRVIEGDEIMDDKEKAVLAAAVVGGYVLGRTKKGRMALSIATYLAGRRFGLEPRQLAAEGMRRLGEIPQVAELQEQLRGEVLEAGRKAMSAAADRGMSTLADTLSDRTSRLLDKADQEEDEEGHAPEDEGEDAEYEEEEEPEEEEPEEEEPEAEYEEDQAEDQPEEEEEPEGEYQEEEPEDEPEAKPRRRRRSRSDRSRGTPAAREKAAPAGREKPRAAKKTAPAKKAAPGKKAAAKKTAPAKKSAAKKTASSKRTASKRADRRR
ncbi:histone protein [Streptomyces sp. NPDC006290]|uniref:histone protein n=1 Tax=Streptomyces sp. NPDC006290 TaxID=3156745 RepID=UPI0033ADAB49